MEEQYQYTRTKEIFSRENDLPKLPGVYKFYDEKNKILYIGKAKNLSNRLKNFIRDNYCKSSDTDKKKVMCPSPMPTQDIAIDNDLTVEDKIFHSQMTEIIEEKLPASLRMTYLKFINNVSITKAKKEELIETLRTILQEEIE